MSLDRTYGLDLYDFEARQYDAIAPWFTSIDPLAEKYYSISPYAYCAGDPVNLMDPTGCAPDSLEAALMADHVYNGEGELSGGWTCTQRGNDSNGLQWGVYARIVEGEILNRIISITPNARTYGNDVYLSGSGSTFELHKMGSVFRGLRGN